MEDNHKSTVFSVSDKFFPWELLLVAIFPYVFQINHKPSVPQMGATKRKFLANDPRPEITELNRNFKYKKF